MYPENSSYRGSRRLCCLSDGVLVGLAERGSLEAYDELMTRYRDPVLLTLRQIVTADAAQDIAQEAFLRAFRSLHQLREPERFGSWVFIIARNLARRRARRSAQIESAPLPIEQADMLGANCPVRAVLAAEQRDTVRSALAELPEPLRIVLSLFYAEGWTAKSIADFLEIPLTTVNWRLHTGRKKVRALIEHLEGTNGG